MAMEVEATVHKELHKQLLPIIILAIGVGLCSITSFNVLTRPSTKQILGSALVTHVLSIEPQHNGLASIHLNPKITQNANAQSLGQQNLGLVGVTSGQAAELSISVVQAGASTTR